MATQPRIIWVFKPIGWTPKDCILECQKRIPNSPKLAFAGRLDPMACGLLPIIINDTRNETKDGIQSTYKTYRFEVIMNLESDTFDILGIIKKRDKPTDQLDLDKIKQTKIQTYPSYSSKAVFSDKHNKQIPLWKLAKEGALPDVLPTREVDIQSIKLLSTKTVSSETLSKMVSRRINSMTDSSNFRIQDILNSWNVILSNNNNYTIHSLEARVSTGTYIRSIGNDLNGIVYDIFRTSVDNKDLDDPESCDKFKFVYDI